MSAGSDDRRMGRDDALEVDAEVSEVNFNDLSEMRRTDRRKMKASREEGGRRLPSDGNPLASIHSTRKHHHEDATKCNECPQKLSEFGRLI